MRSYLGSRVVSALLAGALDLLWPVRCPLCQQWITGEMAGMITSEDSRRPLLHAACFATLAPSRVPCPRARQLRDGIPLWWAFDDTPRFFDILHAAKYSHRPDLLVPLTRVLSRGARDQRGRMVIVPLPDDPVRRAERGYSVTGTVARILARDLDVPVRWDVLVRRRAAPAQAQLPDDLARRDNVRGLFGVGRLGDLDRRVIVIVVEDQVTTGATWAPRCDWWGLAAIGFWL